MLSEYTSLHLDFNGFRIAHLCRKNVREKKTFEDTKGVIRIRKSKNRQHNGQNKKDN